MSISKENFKKMLKEKGLKVTNQRLLVLEVLADHRDKHMTAEDIYELVDGYHRYMVMKTSKRIYERERGLLPVTVIEKDLSNRMASTIRHNRARGTHNIELMSHIVSELSKSGMSDAWIQRNIGMDRDEILRLKQISGLAELFSNKEFSLSEE